MRRKYKSYNKFDIFIILLICSLAFGCIGGSFQVVRVLTILFSPFLIGRIYINVRFLKPYIATITLFLSYASLSLLWTPDMSEGIKELLYFFIHFLAFLEFLVFSIYARNSLKSITTGWLIAVSLTLVVAMWEITTDQHLQWSKSESESMMNTGGEIILHRFAAVTFYNYNGYVTFLCFALPFVLYWFFLPNRTLKNSIIPIVAVILSAVVIFFNASRGGLLAFILMSILLINHFRRRGLFSRVTLFFLGLFSYVVYRYGEIMFLVIGARTSSGIIYEDESRFTIWKNVMEAFSNTYGLGTGIGGIVKAMSRVSLTILVPHNMLLEILLEFGVIFFFVFVIFYLRLLKAAFSCRIGICKIVLLLALLPFPIYAIINSRYLLGAHVYLAFASLIVFANYERIKSFR